MESTAFTTEASYNRTTEWNTSLTTLGSVFSNVTQNIHDVTNQDGVLGDIEEKAAPMKSIKLNTGFAICLGLYVSLLAVTGTVGNIMTILAIGLNKSLQTIPNAFILNLACSDLIIILAMTPTCMVGYFMKMPHLVCKVIGPIFIINLTGSMLNILSIAVNRVIIVTCRSSVYAKIYTPTTVKLHILAIYILGVIYSLPPHFGFGEYGYNVFLGACVVKAFNMGSFYFRSIFIDYLVKLPTIFITLICYIAIILAFVKTRLRLKKVMVGPVSSMGHTNTVLNHTSNEETKTRNETISVLKNLLGIWIMFVLCFIPASISNMLSGIDHHYHHISFALVLTNSAVNVFVYAGMNKAFRKAYKNIILCRMKCPKF